MRQYEIRKRLDETYKVELVRRVKVKCLIALELIAEHNFVGACFIQYFKKVVVFTLGGAGGC